MSDNYKDSKMEEITRRWKEMNNKFLKKKRKIKIIKVIGVSVGF